MIDEKMIEKYRQSTTFNYEYFLDRYGNDSLPFFVLLNTLYRFRCRGVRNFVLDIYFKNLSTRKINSIPILGVTNLNTGKPYDQQQTDQ